MTALFAIAALLWQSVVPLLVPAPQAADELVVICTAHGFKTVSLASIDGSDDSKSGQERPGKVECPLCSGGHASAACLPGGAPLLVADAIASLTVLPAEQHAPSGMAPFGSFLSRAPPVVG